ncbi:MAG: arsenate reductase (glutaredoxin) [Polaribacter sp.]|jgi:arsenate reductase|nr:arsenate reductase (glutaredoxin) [Polaribacter sp.]
MIKIYHNPRCSKSREGVKILENSKQEFETILYLVDLPSEDELKEIIDLLKISPIELVRKNEKIWKDNYKGDQLSDTEIIKVMIKNPRLIERPIVINHKKAIIGRPPGNILSII